MARKDVSSLRDEAAAAVEKGKHKQALELYGELERRQPKDASWPKRVGDVYRRMGDNDQAIAAYERAVEAFAQAGFAVQAIAVCKLILAIDADHAPTLERLTKIAENTSAVRPGAGRRKPVTLTPTRGRRASEVPDTAGPAATIAAAAAAAADAPARPAPPKPAPAKPAPAKPPPTPARAAPPPPPTTPEEPAQIHAPVPRRSPIVSAPVVLPPGTGLDGVALAEIVPGAQRIAHDDGTPSGIAVIPLEEDELELIADDPEESLTAIDSAIADIVLPDVSGPTGATSVADFELPDDWSATPVPPAAPPSAPILDLEARRALLTTPLLAGLPPKALESLVSRLALVELARDEVLFREGDPGACLYVISEGEVIVEHGTEELARLGAGAFFGEVALVTDLPRSASIRASVHTELLALDRDVVRDLVVDHPVVFNVLLKFVRDRLVERVLRTGPLFQPFSPEEQIELSKRFELVEVDPGAPMIKQNERVDGLYVMLAGKVEIWRDGEGVAAAVLGPGEVFGEMSLLAGGGATAHVRAVTRVLALRMPARTFREVIMTHPQVLQYVGELAERRAPRTEASGDFVDLHLDLL